MATTRQTEAVAAGDLVEVSARHVGAARRTGEILEVLGSADHAHYLVRWEDGHTTLFYPREGTTFRRGSTRRERRKTSPTLAPPADEVATFLRAASVEFEVLPHRRTLTAVGEARALGVLPQTVAKTILTEDDEGACIRAVVPATSRLDLAKLAAAAGVARVRLLSEDELVRAYPQFELGAVPPFAGPAGDRVLVDRRLAEHEHVVLEAGVHDASLRLRSEDLFAVTAGQVADIAT